jgi:C6 transcription factor Pro1
MSPASKPSPKKAGAPKTKGAIRAKSGCYTCRIRRKKCDEQRNDSGHCRTCVRLKLECLGFGAKRPDFLKESRNVLFMREKIKAFLASQGMIKGHSASGPRNSEQEFLFLRRVDEYSSDSSASPPTPTLTIPDDTPHSHLTMSNMRSERWFTDPYDSSHSIQHLSPDSSYGSSRVQPFANDVMLAAVPITSSSNSIVSSPSCKMLYHYEML